MKIVLNKKKLEILKAWFYDYVGSFEESDPQHQANITLKIEHSLRVCEEIRYISTQIGLGGGELRLAEAIALLHDIGRFDQYARYKTFADGKSTNHAELGVQVILENGILSGWEKDLKGLVIRSIRYHNRATVPKDETKTCRLFSKLVRDADKLDIWNVVTRYYLRSEDKRSVAIELGLPDRPDISPDIYQALIQGEIADTNHLRTLNDIKLLQVGWAYDLNFEPTIVRAIERGYLDKIRKVLPDTRKVNDIFDAVYSYLNTRLSSIPTGPCALRRPVA